MKTENHQMSHQQCELLLPSYINGKLSSIQQRDVQEHVAQCSECFEQLCEAQQIRENLNHFEPELEALLSQPALEKNLEKTLAGIRSGKPVDTTTDSSGKTTEANVVAISRWRRDWRSASRTIRQVVVAQAACLLVAIAILLQPQPSPFTDYSTLSEPQQGLTGQVSPDYQVYRMVFHPTTTENNLRGLLGSMQGQIISGPSASGVYNVAIRHNAQQEPVILAGLRRSPWVQLAEPAIHRDGESP